MLLKGRWNSLDEHTRDPNVLLIDAPDAIRRPTVPLGPRTLPSLVVLGAMVALLATGVAPAAVADLLAGAMIDAIGGGPYALLHRTPHGWRRAWPGAGDRGAGA